MVFERIVDAQRVPMRLQHRVDLVAQPAAVAELKRPLLVARGRAQERVEPRGVASETWRKLHQDRPEQGPEPFGSLHEDPMWSSGSFSRFMWLP